MANIEKQKIGRKTVVTSGIQGTGPSQTQILEEKTGLQINVAERPAMLALATELGMMLPSSNWQVCHPALGYYQRLIDSFVDVACEKQVMRKREVRERILAYFTHVTNDREERQLDLGAHYREFAFLRDWQTHRDEAYVCLATFIKEMEHMRDHIKTGLQGKPDKVSQAKIGYAEKFTKIAQDVLDAMSSVESTKPGIPQGGISDAARARAADATATFFPSLIEELQKPATPRAADTPQPAVSKADAEAVRKDEKTRKKLFVKDLQGDLANIRAAHSQAMQDWLTLWKEYGEDTKALKFDDGTVVEISTILQTISNTLEAIADPSKPLSSKIIKGLRGRLKFLSEGTVLGMADKIYASGDDDKIGKFDTTLDHFAQIVTLVAETITRCDKIQESLGVK